MKLRIMFMAALVAAPLTSYAQENSDNSSTDTASHTVSLDNNSTGSDFPNKLLWGDTHVHTSYSFDAYLSANRSHGPDTAFRWAKGEAVKHPQYDTKVQIGTPLDFLVIADHAEILGVMQSINEGTYDKSQKDWSDWLVSTFLVEPIVKIAVNGGRLGTALFAFILPKSGATVTKDPVQDPTNVLPTHWLGNTGSTVEVFWNNMVDLIDSHNEPGKFTSFIGWEWSSIPTGANLHRVVFTPDGADKAKQFIPFGSDQSQYPEDLWSFLEKTQQETGARFVAIPHNSNISKGYMFAETTLKDKPITAEYARRRLSWEPVVEITQTKGDSETHPSLTPEDEFADFEQFDFFLQSDGTAEYKATKADFVRSALKTGLKIENKVGANPYKFGLIGSTDAHTALASAEEDNFIGKTALDSKLENKTHGFDSFPTGWSMGAQGFAGVWAVENTREEIFAAFKRKEVYATTGPRISLRLFAGWNFPDNAADAKDIAAIGYKQGVPMGGDLTNNPNASAPQLLIRSVKDPVGANLDRIQVVKGWVDAAGELHEKIYNVAWSAADAGRDINNEGKLPAVGNTIDMKTGNYENSIGEPELATLWTDPDFNRQERSFYYVRVLQIPTPRHSLYDSIKLQEDLPDNIASVIQDRAYSSPIWYTP